MTEHIVYVSEHLQGHAVFDSKEEADAFVTGDNRNFDLIKWTDSDFEVTGTDYTPD